MSIKLFSFPRGGGVRLNKSNIVVVADPTTWDITKKHERV